MLLCISITNPFIDAFSVPNGASFPIQFDRFRCLCPADPSTIRQYDASLNVGEENDCSVWAAVYRSNNNLPTVLLKDDFLNSMRIATSGFSVETTTFSNKLIETTLLSRETPVAVARLRPSDQFNNKYVLDNMRCWLKKEDTNPDCDGGSEHKEALSVAIDALLLRYLNEKIHSTKRTDYPMFEQTIRAKATLVSSQLLEERGFQPVQALCKDMATHTSSLDTCLEKYADRTLNAPLNSHKQAVALQILSKLGLLDRNAELQAALREEESEDDSDNEYDPWAGIRQFI